jgi:MFS family permease
MNNFFETGLIQVKTECYLKIIVFLAPLLNILSGLNLTLYSASMPAIGHYYNASMMMVKNTITATMFGFAIGCIIFGAVLDHIGRRRTIIVSLFAYMLVSLFAITCINIEELILIRFIQGMVVAAITIGSRTLLSDNLTGQGLQTGLLYSSIAYGVGPIIGPFIGGVLQYHFGWESNFIAYTCIAFVLLMLVVLLVNENLCLSQKITLKLLYHDYSSILTHPVLIYSTLITGILQFMLMLYPSIGPYIVENNLALSPIAYGYSILIISCGYLSGTLINRILIKMFSIHGLIKFGFGFWLLAGIISAIFTLLSQFNLWTLILPITIISFSNGFIFPNVLYSYLNYFNKNAGMATALFTSLSMIIGSSGIFIMGQIDIINLKILTAIYMITLSVIIIFYFRLNKHMQYKRCLTTQNRSDKAAPCSVTLQTSKALN